MKFLRAIVLVLIVQFVSGVAFVYSGLYPMGADDPHNAFTHWVLETLRERSIACAAADIKVPNLDDADLLLAGGPDYNEMCASCHLQPGKTATDFTIGLYPSPPNLADINHTAKQAGGESAKRQFWIIKHGIKASGMPAWGPTHDDQRIWAMVAFLQKLPELSPQQYQILTARSEQDDHAHH